MSDQSSFYKQLIRANGYAITINRDARMLTLSKNGAAIRTYPVAVGKKATPTPIGNFSIIEKKLNPGGPFGARWMRFYAGYGMHGTNNPSSIGKAVSNGCVRMYNRDAIELYNKVDYGTPVQIIGSAARPRILAIGVAPGPDVVWLQKTLLDWGYYKGLPHGVFDGVTAWSVSRFQQEQGIYVDGIVGPETMLVLQYHKR